MANDTSAGPEPTREPQKRRAQVSELATDSARGETAGQPQLQVQTASPAGRQTVYEGDSPWQAMHRLSIWVNQDSHQAKELTRVGIADQGSKYGVVAARNDTGQMELEFQTSDAQALYRQVSRERQMELASPADNRISAAAPERTTATRKAERGNLSVEPGAEDLKRSIQDRLEEPAERALSNKADRSDNADLYRQVLERASIEQLRKLQHVAESSPDELGKAIRKLQLQIERDVARDDKQDDKAPAAALRIGPPVNERFTVQERLGRRDYWLRDRPDRLGFTETWLSLRTKEHSAAALMGMVDRAVELGWKRLHLEGTPEFKRESWIIATSRGITAYGYTATLGDREAAQTERKRLTAPVHERTTNLSPAVDVGAQAMPAMPGRSRQPPPEQLRQVVRKAIADGRVSPELEERLTRLLSKEVHKRQTQGKTPIVQAWDPASPRVVAQQRAPIGRGQKHIQRER